jgi:hypothetical protein
MSVCDSYCNGCAYNCYVDNTVTCCMYWFMEDKLRPCPAGVGCTVRKESKKKMQKTEQDETLLLSRD